MTNIDPRYLELIHRDLDDELSDADRAELDAFLDESPAGRNLKTAFSRMNTILERVGDVDPPADLKAAVLASIEPRRIAKPVRNEHPWIAWIRETLSGTTPVMRYGYMAAMMLAALLGYAWLQPGAGPVNPLQAVGTLAPVTQQIAVDTDGVQGTIIARKNAKGVSFQLDLTAAEAVETRIEADFEAENAPSFDYTPSFGALSRGSLDGHFAVEGRGQHGFVVSYEIPGNVGFKGFFTFAVDGEPTHRIPVEFGAAR